MDAVLVGERSPAFGNKSCKYRLVRSFCAGDVRGLMGNALTSRCPMCCGSRCLWSSLVSPCRAPPVRFSHHSILIFGSMVLMAPHFTLTLHIYTDYSLTYYFLLWFTLITISLAFIMIHGIEYVNWPRLVPLTDIIYYDGPGFRSANHGKGFGIPALDMKVGSKVLAKTRKRAGSRLEEIEMGSKLRVD